MPYGHLFNPIIGNFFLYLLKVGESNVEAYLSMFVYYQHSHSKTNNMAIYQLGASYLKSALQLEHHVFHVLMCR